jgi:hypothetical protein
MQTSLLLHLPRSCHLMHKPMLLRHARQWCLPHVHGGKSEAANFTPSLLPSHLTSSTALPSTSPQTSPSRCWFPSACLAGTLHPILPSSAMAEMQGNGKQPPTRRKPSGLRHELRPDSTDDERETKKHIVQVPHSDTVVPETQPDHEERFNNFSRDFDNVTYYGDDVPLSPNSLAVLERTAVTKKPEVLESTSFTVRLLSKEAFSKGESSASSTTPTFSFGQARKDLSRSPPKEEVAAPQPIAHASLTSPPIQQPEEQVPNGNHAFHRPLMSAYSRLDSSVIAPPAVHPQPETSEHAQQDAATGDTPDPNKLLPPSVVSSTSYHQDDANNLG